MIKPPTPYKFFSFFCQTLTEKNLEIEAWQDLTTIYTRLGLCPDAEICVEKAKLIEFYSPGTWHATGRKTFCSGPLNCS